MAQKRDASSDNGNLKWGTRVRQDKGVNVDWLPPNPIKLKSSFFHSVNIY